MSSGRLFHYYWGGVIIALPLYLATGHYFSTRLMHEYGFMVAAILSVLMFGVGRVPKAFSFVLAGLILAAHVHASNFQSAYYSYRLIMLSLGFLVGLQFYTRAKEAHQGILINAIAIACLVQSSLCIVNYFGFRYYEWVTNFLDMGIVWKRKHDALGSTGSLGNPNVAGAFLAITLPALFRPKWIYGIFLAANAILLTNSTAPLITMGVACVVFILNRDLRKKALNWLPLPITAACFVVPYLFNNTRTENWRYALGKLKNSSLLYGQGLDAWVNIVNTERPAKGRFIQMHNEFLEVIFAFGLFGLGAFIFLNMQIERDRIFASIVGAGLVNSFFNFPLHTAATALVLIIAFFYQQRGDHDAIMEW